MRLGKYKAVGMTATQRGRTKVEDIRLIKKKLFCQDNAKALLSNQRIFIKKSCLTFPDVRQSLKQPLYLV